MDRRKFLRSAALVAGGVVSGGAASRLGLAEPLRRLGRDDDALVDRAFANVRGGAALPATNVVWRVETTEKLVALTFDDGPSAEWTPQYLDVLDDRRAVATFNLVGREALAREALVRRELAARHEVQNHSWSHQDLAFASSAEAARQIRRGAEALETITGRRPTWFRPPRGDLSGTALAAAAQEDADIMMWSVQLHEKTMTTDENVAHVLSRLEPGAIILGHDAGGPHRGVGLRALAPLVDGIRARGYELVTVSELVAEVATGSGSAGAAKPVQAAPSPVLPVR